MQKLNLSKNEIAAFDIDAQQTFTPLCPDELPVAGGDMIAEELNAQAAFASVRVASRDAHSPNAVWIAKNGHAPLTPVTGYENCDLYWPGHAIVGTKGFDFIPGLDPKAYSYQVYKGIEPAMHPYGACYHDLKDTLSTGVIEFLKARGIKAVICGGLASWHAPVLRLFLIWLPAAALRPIPLPLPLRKCRSRALLLPKTAQNLKTCCNYTGTSTNSVLTSSSVTGRFSAAVSQASASACCSCFMYSRICTRSPY